MATILSRGSWPSSLTHICGTRGRWVNRILLVHFTSTRAILWLKQSWRIWVNKLHEPTGNWWCKQNKTKHKSTCIFHGTNSINCVPHQGYTIGNRNLEADILDLEADILDTSSSIGHSYIVCWRVPLFGFICIPISSPLENLWKV